MWKKAAVASFLVVFLVLAYQQAEIAPPTVTIAPSKESRAPASLAPAPVAAEDEVQPRIDGYTAALEELSQCYESDACDFPRTDSRTYSFAVGQAIRSELLGMAGLVGEREIQSGEIREIAVKYLAAEDGHVQEAALFLLATQPPSAESMDAILEQVIGGYDAQLIKQAMTELQRYQSDDEKTKIAVALARGMTTGSPFVAKEISADIRPFVQAVNVSVYDSAVASLPEGSTVRDNLENSIRQFRDSD